MINAQVIASSKVITLHSLQQKSPLLSYTHHRGIINSATINHNSSLMHYTDKVIASCGQDGKVFLVSSEKPDNKLMEHNFYNNPKEKIYALSACSFSPTSKFLAVGSVDSLIKIWDLRSDKNSGKQPLLIKSHMGGVTSLTWIKNLKGDNYGSQTIASSSSNGDIYIHSNKTGVFTENMALKLQEGINCIRVSQTNQFCRLAACTNGGLLSIWDLVSGNQKPLWSTSWNSDRKPSINSLSFSPFSQVLLVTASSDNSLVFYDIHQKKSVKTIPTDEALSCVGLHSNGHTLVAGGMYGNLLVYDLRSPNKPINKLVGHETTIKHLQFYKSRDRQTTSNQNKSIKVSSFTNSQSSSSQVSPSVSNHLNQKKTSMEDVRVKQPLRPQQTVKINNFINISKPPFPATDDPYKQKKYQNKVVSSLSVAGHDLNRNTVAFKKQQNNNHTQVGKNDLFSSKSKDNKLEMSMREQKIEIHNQIKSLRSEISTISLGQKQLKQQLYNMQERLNQSMIKQFQLQQQQMREMISNLMKRDREREEYIKHLQAENKRLKSTTF